MKNFLSFTLLVAVLLTATYCNNSPNGDNNGAQQNTPVRKKIGLVLGGGGAKGNATLGVLKVIEQSGVKIDYIAGTSIGAVIGAMYSAGYTAEEIEDIFTTLQWKELILDNLMEGKIRDLLLAKGVNDFSDLKIPFRCVAVNVNTSRDEEFSSGLLYKAIMASVTIPPVYRPVELNGEKYVDGGFVNNLPVDVVKRMGAEFVIAVDLQQSNEDSDLQFVVDLLKEMRIDGFIKWVGENFGKEYELAFNYFKNRPDTIKYIQNKRSVDLYINPVLTNFDASSFGTNNSRNLFSRGEYEANKYLAELQKLK